LENINSEETPDVCRLLARPSTEGVSPVTLFALKHTLKHTQIHVVDLLEIHPRVEPWRVRGSYLLLVGQLSRIHEDAWQSETNTLPCFTFLTPRSASAGFRVRLFHRTVKDTVLHVIHYTNCIFCATSAFPL